MQPNSQQQQYKQLRYLTYLQIEHRMERRQIKHDLFEELLQEEKCWYYGEKTCAKIQQRGRVGDDGKLGGSWGGYRCRCSKIQCLKLYCECFANGRICGQSCQCSSCRNCMANSQQIQQAKMIVNYKHPGYFNGVPVLNPSRRCTCRKSRCRKRYCECFNAGVKCSMECECKECKNGEKDMHDETEDYCQNVTDCQYIMKIQIHV